MIKLPIETVYYIERKNIIANFYFDPEDCITAVDEYYNKSFFLLSLSNKHINDLNKEIEGIKNGTLTQHNYEYYNLECLYFWENELTLINYFRKNGFKETDKIFISLY